MHVKLTTGYLIFFICKLPDQFALTTKKIGSSNSNSILIGFELKSIWMYLHMRITKTCDSKKKPEFCLQNTEKNVVWSLGHCTCTCWFCLVDTVNIWFYLQDIMQCPIEKFWKLWFCLQDKPCGVWQTKSLQSVHLEKWTRS